MKRYIPLMFLAASTVAQEADETAETEPEIRIEIIEELFSDTVELPVASSRESKSRGTMGEYKVKK